MTAFALLPGYWVEQTRDAYTAHSPYGPLGDDFDCWADAGFAAQDHADALAQDAADAAAEDDDLPVTIELPRAA